MLALGKRLANLLARQEVQHSERTTVSEGPLVFNCFLVHRDPAGLLEIHGAGRRDSNVICTRTVFSTLQMPSKGAQMEGYARTLRGPAAEPSTKFSGYYGPYAASLVAGSSPYFPFSTCTRPRGFLTRLWLHWFDWRPDLHCERHSLVQGHRWIPFQQTAGWRYIDL